MTIELEKTHYGKVRPLFESIFYAQNLVGAVFEGNHAGHILVDNPQQPESALVAPACEYFFTAGRPDNPAFNTAMRNWLLSHWASPEGELLLFPGSAAWQASLDVLFADFECLHITRKVFDFNRERFEADHKGWQTQIPGGYTLRRYDHHLTLGTGLPELWGSLDRFLKHGVGFAILHKAEVVSRCHTVMVGNGKAEISIETAEGYRRMGWATLTASAFIDACLAQGLHPAWSCWDNNYPSQMLAKKLGFTRPVDVPVLYVQIKKPNSS